MDQADLKSMLDYDPETGVFVWLRTKSRRIKPGMIAGSLHTRAWQINSKAFGRPMLAHRLAWLFMVGSMPPEGHVIDHIDGNPLNNRFSNLRLCTQQQNTWNQRKKPKNKTGIKGVSQLKNGKYDARVRSQDGIKCLGAFPTIAEAQAAVRDARVRYHGEFANHG